MTALPIYLINMDRAAHRLAFLHRRLDGLGLTFTRIPGVDGAALPDSERTAFAAARPRDGKRGWRPGQIGCFLSHFDAWTRIADGEASFGLVLEDDLHVSDTLPALLGSADWIPVDADIVRLEATGQWLALGPPAGTIAERSVRRIRSSAWGAGAYLLSRAAATRLIASDPAVQSPADDFLFNPDTSSVARALVTYQVVPALAVQDKFSADDSAVKGFGSDIETDGVNRRLRGLAALRRRITSTLRGKTAVEFA